jgi:hypothetical protein
MEVFNQQKMVAESQRLAIFMNGTNRYTVYVVPKVGTQIFCCSANHKSASSWAHSAITDQHIFEVCQSANCNYANL